MLVAVDDCEPESGVLMMPTFPRVVCRFGAEDATTGCGVPDILELLLGVGSEDVNLKSSKVPLNVEG